MSFIDKIKDLVNVPEDEDYEDNEFIEEDYEVEEPPKKQKFEKPFRSASAPERERRSSDYGKFAEAYSGGGRTSSYSDKNERDSKVVNIHTTTQVQVVLAHPDKFEDVRKIADHLNSKRTVVLNLESTQRDVARRIVDFLYGAAYANGGEIRRVAASTFIIIPHNVNIVGDLIDELENNGVFFSE